MSTYVITGGSGFIGSHVCELLVKGGHRVINVDAFNDMYDYRIKLDNIRPFLRNDAFKDDSSKAETLRALPASISEPNYRLEIVDIRDKSRLDEVFQSEPIDAVVHLAALPGVRASIDQPLEFEEVNVRGTLNLLECMKEHGVKKWVCASSSSVYGNNEKTPFEEGDPVDFPISLYAATKRSCELIGATYQHLYGIDAMMLRFFTVYGERQRPDLAIHKFTDMIFQGKEIPFYGDGTTMRDYTYIEDIVAGVVGSLRYVEEHSNVYEILNLGGDRTITLKSLVETIEKETGMKAKLNRLGMQAGDVNRTCANIDKARRLIGFSPSTSFEEGIHRFVTWYKGERKGETIRRRTHL
ncbi:GDP-mannose 4,6-dehydratase [Paenibacillus sp. HB172176]|uniref:GDP-mannose 4,6-dehydratase n=1 Tax=Paenibacillus sp. HB172176 TaxID=2493690 RepID=UPI00143B0429|nr:GDP-mannose 4,6-dehydratase [Paenibacillus sp. HB172176]